MIKTLHIISIEKGRDVVEQTEHLVVNFNLIDDKSQIIETFALAFDLSLSPKEIQDELKKYLEVKISDEKRSIENADFEEAQKNADIVISSLTGVIIN